MASSEPHPTEPIHADRSRTRDVQAGHLGCARCMQPLGDQIPSRCPECGVALDPANPRSVCDLRNRRDRVELMMALAAGIVVGGLLGFGWWFGLMKHNQWAPDPQLARSDRLPCCCARGLVRSASACPTGDRLRDR